MSNMPEVSFHLMNLGLNIFQEDSESVSPVDLILSPNSRKLKLWLGGLRTSSRVLRQILSDRYAHLPQESLSRGRLYQELRPIEVAAAGTFIGEWDQLSQDLSIMTKKQIEWITNLFILESMRPQRMWEILEHLDRESMIETVSLFPVGFKRPYLSMIRSKIKDIFDSSGFGEGQSVLLKLLEEREEVLRCIKDESIPVDVRYRKKISISNKLSCLSQNLRKALHHLAPWTLESGKKLLSLDASFESDMCKLKDNIFQMLRDVTNLGEFPPISGSEQEEADEEILGWLLQVNAHSGKKVTSLLETLLIEGPELYERGIVSSKDIKALGIPLNFFQRSSHSIEILSSKSLTPEEKKRHLTIFFHTIESLVSTIEAVSESLSYRSLELEELEKHYRKSLEAIRRILHVEDFGEVNTSKFSIEIEYLLNRYSTLVMTLLRIYLHQPFVQEFWEEAREESLSEEKENLERIHKVEYPPHIFFQLQEVIG